MSSVKFKLNKKGGREVLKSPEVANLCLHIASSIANDANAMSFSGGYSAETRNYPKRTGAAVFPSTIEANIDNLQQNTLEKVKKW